MRLLAGLLFIGFFSFFTAPEFTDWGGYNGGDNRNHFSPLTQINVSNVKNLRLAWSYSSGGADTVNQTTQIQCNPIIIQGVMYGVSAGSQAFAVDAKSGREIWKTTIQEKTPSMNSRGVAFYSSPGQRSKIFFGFGSYLFALDAKTGKPVETFGEKGKINLLEGLKRPGSDDYTVLNTPISIYKNTLIVGTRVSESAPALLGDIRAFDATSGRLIWTFHTIPKPGEYGYKTWEKNNYKNVGGANNWMGMAVDSKRGIVFVPTGSAAFDFYGGNRKGDNLFANCLLALDIRTGKRLWHFQTVHHDIWDRDIPAPPNLFTITQNGKKRDVVSILSKLGFMFVFDRVTGKPIFPIEERPFPASDVVGEQTSKTQPIPLWPLPFVKQTFTEKDVNEWASNKDEIIAELRNSQTGQPFIPLSITKKTIFFPATDGGATWGGAAVDENSVIYIPAKQNPVYSSLVPVEKSIENSGKSLYVQHCQSCHGVNREGSEDGTIPTLREVHKKYSEPLLNQILVKGRGRMPAFNFLSAAEKKAILAYTQGLNLAVEGPVKKSTLDFSPFSFTGYTRWYDSKGYPVSRPPWGTLTAIEMNTGKHLWQIPLGEYPELTAKGIPPTGTDLYGGPAVTAGGLLFIAATRDEMFRALDRQTGKILWQYKLPAAGYASPSIYSIDGVQYIVIACGGGKVKTKSGDKYLAFALGK
jgi:quinoprotein glucose dehydrogenase